MASDDFTRKAINFDLDTDSLKKVFNSNNPFVYLKGYKQIGAFLKLNGFTHRQWSGYISEKPLTPIQVTAIVKGLNQALPWLKKCVKKFDVTNIGETYDLTYVFKQSPPPVKSKEVSADKSQSQPSASMSMSQLQKAAEIAEQVQQQAPQEQNRQNNRSKSDVSI